MKQSERLIIEETTRLIYGHPERFTRDGYHVSEIGKDWRRGIRVWVANGRWALSIEHDGRKVADGGIVVMALAPWRYQLWSACMAIPSTEDAAQNGALAYLKAA